LQKLARCALAGSYPRRRGNPDAPAFDIGGSSGALVVGALSKHQTPSGSAADLCAGAFVTAFRPARKRAKGGVASPAVKKHGGCFVELKPHRQIDFSLLLHPGPVSTSLLYIQIV
jgi:hypothetical protein